MCVTARNLGQFEQGLKPSLPFADRAVELRFPSPEEMPLARLWGCFQLSNDEIRQDAVDGHARFLGVKEEFVSRNSVHAAPHCVANSHSRVAQDENECPEALRVCNPRPIESQIVEASEEVPLLSMLLRLDMSIVREILNREDLPEADVSSQRRGVAVGQAPAGLLKACSRLMELLDIPEDIPFLSHLIQREIIYRILRTPQGARLRTIATTGDLGNRTARAINWLRDNYTKPLHLEELAGIARMGVSTLQHQFRTLTAMSPLQYQKQLRLQRARERMLMDGVDATSAAYEVGYESVSQFNREYGRFFGQPPMRDIKTLRAANA